MTPAPERNHVPSRTSGSGPERTSSSAWPACHSSTYAFLRTSSASCTLSLSAYAQSRHHPPHIYDDAVNSLMLFLMSAMSPSPRRRPTLHVCLHHQHHHSQSCLHPLIALFSFLHLNYR